MTTFPITTTITKGISGPNPEIRIEKGVISL